MCTAGHGVLNCIRARQARWGYLGNILQIVPSVCGCSDQAGEVVSVAVHPSNDYLITAAADGTWCFYDVQSALCLTQVTNAVP